MSLIAESMEIAAEAPHWSLPPSEPRVAAIDEALRFRLAELLAYLAEVAPLATHWDVLAQVEHRLKSGPVSSWVFCLYSKLVSELAKSPRGDVSAAFGSVVEATLLPADAGIVCLRDQTVPAAWWDHFRILFDTDRRRPFRPDHAEPGELCCLQGGYRGRTRRSKASRPGFLHGGAKSCQDDCARGAGK